MIERFSGDLHPINIDLVISCHDLAGMRPLSQAFAICSISDAIPGSSLMILSISLKAFSLSE
jgi:hypothetical protein